MGALLDVREEPVVLRRLRRVALVIATAAIGLGSVAHPAAAAADEPQVDVHGEVFCNLSTGHFVVEWLVQSHAGAPGTIVSASVQPSGSTPPPGVVGHPVTLSGQDSLGAQVLPVGATTASITLGIEYPSLGLQIVRTGTVAVTGSCGLVRIAVTFARRCDGQVEVSIDYPASAPSSTAAEVYGRNDAGATSGFGRFIVAPGEHIATRVPQAWTAGVSVEQDGVPISSVGNLPQPAGCTQPAAPLPPTAGGGPAATTPNPGASTAMSPADPAPTTEPAPTQSSASVPPTPDTTATEAGSPSLRLTSGDGVRTLTIAGSSVLAVLIAVGAFTVVAMRRRRIRVVAVPAAPSADEPESTSD
jgi:hypothetical protein